MYLGRQSSALAAKHIQDSKVFTRNRNHATRFISLITRALSLKTGVHFWQTHFKINLE